MEEFWIVCEGEICLFVEREGRGRISVIFLIMINEKGGNIYDMFL